MKKFKFGEIKIKRADPQQLTDRLLLLNLYIRFDMDIISEKKSRSTVKFSGKHAFCVLGPWFSGNYASCGFFVNIYCP